MKRYFQYLYNLYKTYALRDKFMISAKLWFKNDGDNTFRLNYSLNENSVVFDIGGYEGLFAEKIFQKYGCTIYIFEPINIFYQNICNKFKNNPKIKVFNFGISNRDGSVDISFLQDGSSIHYDGCARKERIKIRSAAGFILENKLDCIDLMKINIEGEEFQVLPLLIKSGLVTKVRNIQVQFHNFIANAEIKRKKIRSELSKTHQLTYDYYFIWENWELKC